MTSSHRKVRNFSFKNLMKTRLFNNMSWLFILNFSNKIIPFFTFPYITRILLPEGFGIITFSLAFISYFQVFIDYGFNLTGARKVATAEDNKQELSKTYTSIMTIKFLFFLVSVPLIILITLLNSSLFEYRDIVFIFILLALSHVLMPTWIFQGIQKVKYMTFISLSVRIAFLISVFIFIKSPNDLALYAILYSSSFLIIGIISMLVINFHLKIKFCKISISDLLGLLKDGFYVFLSSAVISVMSSTGVFVLGLFYIAEFSGYYSAVTKINQIITMFFYPIGQALFPYHSKKYTLSFNAGYTSVFKIAKLIIPVFSLISMVVIIFREQIVWVVLGQNFLDAANLLIVMAFLPLLSIVSNLMGTQILVASGHTKEYSRAFLRGALVSISLYFVLGYYFSIWGVVTAAIVGEMFSLLMLYIEVRKIVRYERE